MGYQPEEMVIVGNKLYVANSGGYRVPNYDNTVSVIDLETFKETKKITVAINLHRMRVDQNGLIYVTSRGDYYNVHSNTYVINAKNDLVEGSLNFPASELYLCGDSLYSYSTEYSKITSKWTVNYTIYDTKAKRIVSRNFIKDGTEKSIVTPYALAVNPETGEIFVGDAGDYVTPGGCTVSGLTGRRNGMCKREIFLLTLCLRQGLYRRKTGRRNKCSILKENRIEQFLLVCYKFKVSNAIHANGTTTDLKYIDFIKIQTGVNAKSGIIGEVSTEVFSVTDKNVNN